MMINVKQVTLVLQDVLLFVVLPTYEAICTEAGVMMVLFCQSKVSIFTRGLVTLALVLMVLLLRLYPITDSVMFDTVVDGIAANNISPI